MIPAAGQTIGQHVRLTSLLGRGGMGSVWRAHHEGLGIDVAVKFIAKDLLESENPLVVARFSREAKLVARLDNQHVVRVMDHGVCDHGPFIVMELLRGQSLGDRLLAEQRIAPDDAVEIMNQIAAGLEHAHAHDVVHRDVKPANIFLCAHEKGRTPVVKLLDFGIAKSDKLAEAMGAATATGGLIGTPQYMSPEQLMRAGPVTPAVDLWALGVVAFEMLTGKLPFAGETLAATLIAITRAEPPSPRKSVPGLSSDLDRFFRRALHADAHHRFTNAGEMAEAFAAAAAGSSPPSIKQPVQPITDPNLSTSEFLALQTPPRVDDAGAFAPTLPQEGPRRAPPRRGLFLAGGALLTLAGVVAIVMLTRKEPTPSTVATESSPVDESLTAVTVAPSSSESAPSASGSSAPIAVLANLPITKIPEGTGTLAATFFPGFDVMREPGDENVTLRGAQDACERKQMSLCTEGQWLRACEVIPALGTAPSWTLAGSVDGAVVRGGQGACTDKYIVAPNDKAARRVGVCCTRAVGMTSLTNPSTPFLKSVGAQILQVERLLNSSNGFELSRTSAAEVNFFGKRYLREELRDVVIQFGRSSSNYFAHCSVDIRTTPTSKGWLAECSGLQFGGKAVVAFTRILRSTEGSLDELREARNPRPIPNGAVTP